MTRRLDFFQNSRRTIILFIVIVIIITRIIYHGGILDLRRKENVREEEKWKLAEVTRR